MANPFKALKISEEFSKMFGQTFYHAEYGSGFLKGQLLKSTTAKGWNTGKDLQGYIDMVMSREKGLGTAAVKNFEEWVSSKGGRSIRLTAATDSIGFWKKMGFTTDPLGAKENEMLKSLATPKSTTVVPKVDTSNIRWKNIGSSGDKKYWDPKITNDFRQLEGVISGDKPIYLGGTDSPNWISLIKKGRRAGLDVSFGTKRKPYIWDREGNVIAASRPFVIHPKEGVHRARQVLYANENRGPMDEYHKKLGRLLGYRESDIASFIEGIKFEPPFIIPKRGEAFNPIKGMANGPSHKLTGRVVDSDFGSGYIGGNKSGFRAVEHPNSWSRYFSKRFNAYAEQILGLNLWDMSPFHQRQAISKLLGVPVTHETVTKRLGKSRVFDATKLNDAAGYLKTQPYGPHGTSGPVFEIGMGSASLDQIAYPSLAKTITREKRFLRARHAVTAIHESAEYASMSTKIQLYDRSSKLGHYVNKRYTVPTRTEEWIDGRMVITDVYDLNAKGKRLHEMISARVKIIRGDTLNLGHVSRDVLDLEAYGIGMMGDRLGEYRKVHMTKHRFQLESDSASIDRYWSYIRAGKKAKTTRAQAPTAKNLSKVMMQSGVNLSKLGEGGVMTGKKAVNVVAKSFKNLLLR